MSEHIKLIDAYLDGNLSDQEGAQLSAWVKASAENAKIFAREAFLDRQIRDMAAGELVSQQLMAEVCSASSIENSDTRVLIPTDSRQRGQRISRRRVGVWLSTSLAVMLMGVFYAWGNLAWEPTTVTAERGTAMVADVADVEWTNPDAVWKVGDRLGPDVVKFQSGSMRLDYGNGMVVSLKGQAQFDVMSSKRGLLRAGQATVTSPRRSVGFQIYTPNVGVTDVIGSRFGVEIGLQGETNIVVFDGAVHVKCFDVLSPGSGCKTRLRLSSGEGARITSDGTATRIETIVGEPSEDYWSTNLPTTLPNGDPVVLQRATDNYQGERSKFYRIVHGGFAEDAQAYVDHYHEWNGVGDGIPAELLGADYLLPFRATDLASDHQITVSLAQPATVYVLMDESTAMPDWLVRDFEDTGWRIGLDQLRKNNAHSPLLGVGPGRSIDRAISVWKRNVAEAAEVTLGPMSEEAYQREQLMFGIVAVPLSES